MSEPTDRTELTMEINDLPPEETLTAEEKERLAGAGRPSFRPMLEAFEARELMSASPVTAPVAPWVRIATVQPPDAAPKFETANATSNQFFGSSDASAAIPIQYKEGGVIKDGLLVGDDKSDVIRLYDLKTGKIVAEYDLGAVTGTKFQPNGTGVYVDNKGKSWGTSSDIEAAVRVNDRIYWMTSSGDVIETHMVFSRQDGGFFQALEPVRKVEGLAKAMAKDAVGKTDVFVPVLDKDNKEVMKKMTLAEALGKDHKNYHNIEAFAIGPDGTAYIGFRAPLGGEKGGGLLIPVKNFTEWVGSDGKTAPQFGKAIVVELEGHRGIRDIVWSPEMSRFVILAGNYGVEDPGFPLQRLSTQLYVWDGPGTPKATKLMDSGTAPDGKSMSFETIGSISKLPNGKWEVQLLCDDGSTSHGKKASDGKTVNSFPDRYFWGEYYSFSLPPKKL